MNRADACANPSCRALLIRDAATPAPTHCPRCGQPIPVVEPRTGRWAPRPFVELQRGFDPLGDS